MRLLVEFFSHAYFAFLFFPASFSPPHRSAQLPKTFTGIASNSPASPHPPLLRYLLICRHCSNVLSSRSSTSCIKKQSASVAWLVAWRAPSSLVTLELASITLHLFRSRSISYQRAPNSILVPSSYSPFGFEFSSRFATIAPRVSARLPPWQAPQPPHYYPFLRA